MPGKNKFRLRFVPLVAFLALALAMLAILTSKPLSSLRFTAYDLTQRPAPEFSLPLLDAPEASLSLKSFEGKPAIVNFFASWCVPCQVEHPALLSLSEHHPVYGIAWKNKEEDLRNWLGKNQNPYQLIALDNQGTSAVDFGIHGVPETFVLNRKGVIVHHHIGPLSQHDVDKALLPLMERLEHEAP